MQRSRYMRVMSCLEMMSQSGSRAKFTPNRLTAVVIVADGSEYHFPAVIMEHLVLRGLVEQETEGIVITIKGQLQAARERDRGM